VAINFVSDSNISVWRELEQWLQQCDRQQRAGAEAAAARFTVKRRGVVKSPYITPWIEEVPSNIADYW
jgi:hypothetical protein